MAYDSADSRIKHYRVDKMLRIRITDERRLGRDTFRAFDMARYAKSLFGMYGGEETDVIIEGDNDMVGVVIDRFGKDIAIAQKDADTFEARVTVAVSPQFFGWIMGLGGGVRIAGPAPVVKQMQDEIRRLSARYGL